MTADLPAYRASEALSADIAGAPAWHVLVVEPGAERVAAAHLAARRFGVYLPEFDVHRRRHGRSWTVRRPLFPGYLFVFVWDALRHLRRLRACPGVLRLLFDGDAPYVVSDALIDRIQQLEADVMAADVAELELGRVRRRRRFRKAKVVDDGGNQVILIRCFDALAGKRIDLTAQIGLLHRALGLASRPCA